MLLSKELLSLRLGTESSSQGPRSLLDTVPLSSVTQKPTQETKPTRAVVGLALRAVTKLVIVFQEWTGDSRATQTNTNPQQQVRKAWPKLDAHRLWHLPLLSPALSRSKANSNSPAACRTEGTQLNPTSQGFVTHCAGTATGRAGTLNAAETRGSTSPIPCWKDSGSPGFSSGQPSPETGDGGDAAGCCSCCRHTGKSQLLGALRQ